MAKKLAFALAATLASSTALASGVPTPEELLLEWGYLSGPGNETQIVEFAPAQPRNAAEAYMLSHGLPVVGLERDVIGRYEIHPATPRKLNPVQQLLADWNHIKVPTSITATFVPVEEQRS
ncbi:MAG: hypothetical protein GX093_09535 [Xanthomonadaceae bacterium]|nr:hypothetical protein [Xanthomonadaceae bacterium]